MRSSYLLITLPGLERVVEQEAKRLGLRVPAQGPPNKLARVVVEGEVADVRKMRTIECAMLIAGRLDLPKPELSTIRHRVRDFLRESTLLEGILKDSRCASVRCSIVSVRGYTKSLPDEKTLERVIAREVSRVFPDLVLVPEGGDVRVRAEFYPRSKELLIGVEVTPLQPMHRRSYAVMRHPAMLNPIIAAAAAHFAEVRKGYVIYDPFCGAGTIPIEFALVHKKVRILASDVSPKWLLASITNARMASVHDRIEFVTSDVGRYVVRKNSINLIVTDPPRGHREIADPASLLEKAFSSFVEVLEKDNGAILLITPLRQLVEVIARKFGLSISRELSTLQGGMKVSLLYLVRSS